MLEVKGVGGVSGEGEGEERGSGISGKTRKQGAKLDFSSTFWFLEKDQVRLDEKRYVQMKNKYVLQ